MENIIIIKNLPKDIYAPELCDEFRCYGKILSAMVLCDKNKVSTGEANIEFDQTFSALKAVRRMNNSQLRNKKIQVSLASENERFKKVYVKNFSPDWDVCDLLKAFEHCGKVESVKISEENGRSNGYGFVLFKKHDEAMKAINSMNGKTINGKELVVERFKNKSERDNLVKNSVEDLEKRLERSTQRNNLHIKNLPANMNEDELRKMFQKYGNITSVYIPVNDDGHSLQFGFVCFEKEDDAGKARKRMNGYTLDGKRLEINFKQDGQLRKQLNSLKYKENEIKIREYRKRSQSMPKFVPELMFTRMEKF